MANKSYKKFKKEEKQEKKSSSLSETLSNPTKKWWGKLAVVILTIGFVCSTLVALIIEIIDKF